MFRPLSIPCAILQPISSFHIFDWPFFFVDFLSEFFFFNISELLHSVYREKQWSIICQWVSLEKFLNDFTLGTLNGNSNLLRKITKNCFGTKYKISSIYVTYYCKYCAEKQNTSSTIVSQLKMGFDGNLSCSPIFFARDCRLIVHLFPRAQFSFCMHWILKEKKKQKNQANR